jgi:transcriptional regulator with XRE-family HTH domain
MVKTLCKEEITQALRQEGLSQATLAKKIGVSAQAVSNWLKGVDFPRPDKLLKLAQTLKLTYSQLVQQEPNTQPIIAFRKRAGAKTTEIHIEKARAIGMLLKPLVPFLKKVNSLRLQLVNPTTDYEYLRNAAQQTRHKIGLGDQAVLEYHQLINQFQEVGTVLVPVMWGPKNQHHNAIHIHLPKENVTFIFLNLDTKQEDFKFWMAHELAHVYTPSLVGSNEGEDFADQFAAHLLFPTDCAASAYQEAIKAKSEQLKIACLKRYADHHNISLLTVFNQVQSYAKNTQNKALEIDVTKIHIIRNTNSKTIELMSEKLFKPMPPTAANYIQGAENLMQTEFFQALKTMVLEKEIGPTYIQQILDIALVDASAIHQELRS